MNVIMMYYKHTPKKIKMKTIKIKKNQCTLKNHYFQLTLKLQL